MVRGRDKERYHTDFNFTLKVMATAGDTHLGGEDVDRAIALGKSTLGKNLFVLWFFPKSLVTECADLIKTFEKESGVLLDDKPGAREVIKRVGAFL